MKSTLIVALFFFFLGFPSQLYSYVDPAPYFCQKQGYIVQEEGTQVMCLFPDGNKCHVWAFLSRVCGQQYRRPLPCVARGQIVFLEFDQCCRGLQPMYDSKKAKVLVCKPAQQQQPR